MSPTPLRKSLPKRPENWQIGDKPFTKEDAIINEAILYSSIYSSMDLKTLNALHASKSLDYTAIFENTFVDASAGSRTIDRQRGWDTSDKIEIKTGSLKIKEKDTYLSQTFQTQLCKVGSKTKSVAIAAAIYNPFTQKLDYFYIPQAEWVGKQNAAGKKQSPSEVNLGFSYSRGQKSYTKFNHCRTGTLLEMARVNPRYCARYRLKP